MAKREIVKTINNRTPHEERAASSIKDLMRHVERDCAGFALVALAAEAMATLCLLVDAEGCEIDWVFEASKREALSNLNYRANHWQSKLAAVKAQNKADH
jgi:hypothetical protein